MGNMRISIRLDLDGTGVSRGLSGISASFLGLERTATSTMRRIGGAVDALGGGRRLAAIGGIAAGFGLVAVGIKKALGPAIEFEDAFAGVLKTVEGSPRQLAGVRQSILDMANEIPVAATHLADIAAAAGQLGVRVPNITEFTRVTAELAVTTDLGFEAAARNMARFLNVMDGGVDNIDVISDVLVDLGNNFATTESQILTFANRLSGAFASIDATPGQALAVATAFSAMGIEAEAGGSAISRVLIEISDAAKNGTRDLTIYAGTAGILPEQFAAIAKENPVEAFRLFEVGLGRMADEGKSITPVLEALNLNTIRITRALLVGANGSDVLTAALQRQEVALENNNARSIEAAKRFETTASRLQVLENRIKGVAIAAGTPLLAGFALAVDNIGDAILEAKEALEPFGESLVRTFSQAAEAAQVFYDILGSPALQTASAALVGLSTALTGLLEIFNSLGIAGPVFAGLAIAMLRLTSAASLAGTAIGVIGLDLIAAARAGTLASTVFGGLKAVVGAAGPWAIFAGAVISSGKAIQDAQKKADQATSSIRGLMEQAQQSNDFTTFDRAMADTRDRAAELAEQAHFTGGAFGGMTRFAGIFADMLPLVNTGMIDTIEELKQINDIAEDGLAFEQMSINLGIAADQLGLTKEATANMATELGLLDVITEGAVENIEAGTVSFEEFNLAVAAIGATLNEIGGQEFTLGFLEKLYSDEPPTLGEYANELGIAAEHMKTLAEEVAGVKFDDLFADDIGTREAALQAISSMIPMLNEMAAATSQGTEEFLQQVAALSALSDAHSALTSSINAARSAQEQMRFQQELLTTATSDYDEALTAVQASANPDNLRAYAAATQELVLAQAANAASADDAVAGYVALRASFIENAVAAGANRAEVELLVDELLSMPTTAITDIQSNAADVTAEVEILQDGLDQLEIMTLIELGLLDNASPQLPAVIKLLDTIGRNEGWTAVLQAADAGAGGMISEVIGLTETYVGQYVATLLAEDGGSLPLIPKTQGELDALVKEYLATLTADPQPAFSDIISVNASLDELQNRRTTVTVTANTSAADSVLRATRNIINSIPLFRRINIVASYSSRGGGGRATQSADGSIQTSGGTSAPSKFFSDAELARHKFVSPQPGIYSARSPGYLGVFGEPETGGEALIPLGPNKRSQALQVFGQTGRILGVFNNGGFVNAPVVSARSGFGGQVPLIINAPMVFDIRGSNMAPAEVARIAGQEVQRVLGQVGRQLALRR